MISRQAKRGINDLLKHRQNVFSFDRHKRALHVPDNRLFEPGDLAFNDMLKLDTIDRQHHFCIE